MAGGLSQGFDNDCLSGVGHTEIGIGAHQPNYAIETRLEFDIDHDWKTRREIFVMPKVNIVTKSVTRYTLFEGRDGVYFDALYY